MPDKDAAVVVDLRDTTTAKIVLHDVIASIGSTLYIRDGILVYVQPPEGEQAKEALPLLMIEGEPQDLPAPPQNSPQIQGENQSKGGYARAANLSPEKRTAIALSGAEKRWRNYRQANPERARLEDLVIGTMKLQNAPVTVSHIINRLIPVTGDSAGTIRSAVHRLVRAGKIRRQNHLTSIDPPMLVLA